jgi:hypothetical protein
MCSCFLLRTNPRELRARCSAPLVGSRRLSKNSHGETRLHAHQAQRLVRALRIDQEGRPIHREPLGPFERLEVFPLLGPHGIRASMRVAIPTNQTEFSVRRSRRLRRSDCMSRCRRTFRRGKLQRGLDSIQSNTPTPRSSRCHVVRTGCSALFLFPGLYALIKDRLQSGALRDHGIRRVGGEPLFATARNAYDRFGSIRLKS